MDELFQRAGEDYQLQEAQSGWEGIFERINVDNTTTVAGLNLYNKARRFIYASLPLLISSILFTLVPKSVKDCISEVKSVDKISGKINGAGLKRRENNLENTSLVLRYKNPNYKGTRVNHQPEYVHGNINSKTISEENVHTAVLTDDDTVEIRNIANNIDQVNTRENSFSKIVNVDLLLNDKIKTDSNQIHRQQDLPKKLKNNKGFYFGIAGSVELNKVGSKTPAKQGLSAGVLLGYAANSRFSIETGIMLNRKKYKTKGSDFSLDKIGANMPAGMVINDLESKTTIIEIPLKLKYDITRKTNSSFFITGGVSASIVTREKNNYNVSMNGLPEKMTGDYQKNNYKIPGIASLSIGYEHKISKYFEIRMEPFLKIPLQGIGVGNLRVKSAGLQIGIIVRPK